MSNHLNTVLNPAKVLSPVLMAAREVIIMSLRANGPIFFVIASLYKLAHLQLQHRICNYTVIFDFMRFCMRFHADIANSNSMHLI